MHKVWVFAWILQPLKTGFFEVVMWECASSWKCFEAWLCFSVARTVRLEAVFLFNSTLDDATRQETDENNPSVRLYSAALKGHIGTTVSVANEKSKRRTRPFFFTRTLSRRIGFAFCFSSLDTFYAGWVPGNSLVGRITAQIKSRAKWKRLLRGHPGLRGNKRATWTDYASHRDQRSRRQCSQVAHCHNGTHDHHTGDKSQDRKGSRTPSLQLEVTMHGTACQSQPVNRKSPVHNDSSLRGLIRFFGGGIYVPSKICILDFRCFVVLE